MVNKPVTVVYETCQPSSRGVTDEGATVVTDMSLWQPPRFGIQSLNYSVFVMEEKKNPNFSVMNKCAFANYTYTLTNVIL